MQVLLNLGVQPIIAITNMMIRAAMEWGGIQHCYLIKYLPYLLCTMYIPRHSLNQLLTPSPVSLVSGIAWNLDLLLP